MYHVSVREPDVLRRLREETSKMPDSRMQLAPDQAQLLALLVRSTGARKTLEVGVFTGYSSTAVALALPAGGTVTACDVSEEYTSVARRYWKEAGVEGKITLHVAPALGTLERLIAEGGAGSYDFALIDADKENYLNYYERALVLLRQGGLMAFDNVLWSGRVVDPAVNDEGTQAIRAFNQKLHGDERIWLSMVPSGDGLTLACKR